MNIVKLGVVLLGVAFLFWGWWMQARPDRVNLANLMLLVLAVIVLVIASDAVNWWPNAGQ